MDHDDRWDDQVRDAYRRPIAGEERAREQVIARLREEPAPRRSRWSGWWMDPDAIRMRPLLAVASLIMVLGIGAGAGAWWAASRGASIGSPRSTTVVARQTARGIGAFTGATAVTFVFRAPGASRVSLVGDFNGWNPEATPLRRATLGDTWIAEVPLERGLHAYAFVIDGSDWAPDPSAPLAAEASFGRRNSLVVVGEGGPL
ncbi:MAG: hypothetical protein DMD82_12670 [Candidatus Rokuibacteriota bacterium]|nr:MAG: hypothetical protein DMD82_12670 [Candidatus Rokubacteria bacterium]